MISVSAMKFKLILNRTISRILGLVFSLLVKLSKSKLDYGSSLGTIGDLAEICIRGYDISLIPENDKIGVEHHLSQEVY